MVSTLATLLVACLLVVTNAAYKRPNLQDCVTPAITPFEWLAPVSEGPFGLTTSDCTSGTCTYKVWASNRWAIAACKKQHATGTRTKYNWFLKRSRIGLAQVNSSTKNVTDVKMSLDFTSVMWFVLGPILSSWKRSWQQTWQQCSVCENTKLHWDRPDITCELQLNPVRMSLNGEDSDPRMWTEVLFTKVMFLDTPVFWKWGA